MKKMGGILAVLLILTLLLTACGQTPNTPSGGQEEPTPAPQVVTPEETETEPETQPETQPETEQEEDGRGDDVPFTVSYGKDVENAIGGLDTYVMSDGEYSTEIAFFFNIPVKNFRMVNLTITDFREDGEVEYIYEDSVYIGDTDPQLPIPVRVTFMGDMPNVGCALEDGDGNLRIFAISQSGMDGSLFVQDWSPKEK